MAIVRLIDGREQTLTAEQGAEMWAVLTGELEPNEAQEAFCLQVKKIYLNWRNAPDSYITDRFEIIAPMVFGRFMVRAFGAVENGRHTATGELTLPEPQDDATWKFCTKWGLIKDRKVTALGNKYMYGGKR